MNKKTVACFYLSLSISLVLFFTCTGLELPEDIKRVKPTPVITDKQIEKNVKDAIIENEGLAPFSLSMNVVVNNGIVTLVGTVDNYNVKKNLEATANSVPGVQNVINQLRVHNDPLLKGH